MTSKNLSRFRYTITSMDNEVIDDGTFLYSENLSLFKADLNDDAIIESIHNAIHDYVYENTEEEEEELEDEENE